MKKIFSIFAALLFAGSMMAADVTVSKTVHDLFPDDANGTKELTLYSDAAITISANNNGNNGKIYGTGTEWRIYQSDNGKIFVNGEDGVTIKTVKFTYDVANTGTLKFGDDVLASGTAATVNAQTATFTAANTESATNGQIKVKSFEVVYDPGSISVVSAPTFTPSEGDFVGEVNVSLACETTGAKIYYTTDGETPTASSTEYTAAFKLNATTTVKAIAIKDGTSSSVAEKIYTAYTALTTTDQIFADAEIIGSTAADRFITFDDWIVSGVTSDGKTAYVTDGTKGFIVYTNSGHGLGRDDVLSGTAKVSLKLYKGAAEIVDLTSTTTGLTVNPGGLLDPTVLDADGIATLSGVNTGGLFTIDGAYEYFSEKDHVAGLQVHNGLFNYSAFETGYNYQLTGVYLQFDATGEIMPRQSTDIVKGGAASRIIADDVNLGTITTTGEWREITIDVTTDNVSNAVTIFETSGDLNIIPDETYLDASGGTIKASLDLTKAGNYVATIDLRAGAVKRVVKITAKVIIQHEIPDTDTSDPKITGVTQASNAKVKIQVSGTDSVTYDAIKLGNSSTGGTMTIKVGAGAERLYFYAAAWTGAAGTISVSAPAGVTLSAGELVDGKLTLIADAGITGNSPFKLAKKLDDAWIYLFEIELDGVTEETTITLSSGTAKRFVVWGAKQYKGTATAIENAVVNENKAVKQIVNGQVIIIRNGVRYNVIGQVIE